VPSSGSRTSSGRTYSTYFSIHITAREPSGIIRSCLPSIQALSSDYERDRLRVTAEMVVRIAGALEMTADELLGIKKAQPNGSKPSRKILRRLEKIDELRAQQQATLLRTTIDNLLRGATK
jgi:hypothetical protein